MTEDYTEIDRKQREYEVVGWIQLAQDKEQ
jgi:hypothetical protein